MNHADYLSEDDDDLREYNLEEYDSQSDADNGQSVAMLGNVRSLAYHDSNMDDPYITAKDEEEEDEKEELQVLATDNMLVAAKVEDEVAHLEIYVYEDEAENLYVHHDVMLPAIPLCVEWLDLPVGRDTNLLDKDRRGNFVAVGTFEPDIELWDLDTVDAMYPNAILGEGGKEQSGDADDKATKKKKKRKSKKANDEYHVDAVLSLVANRQHRNLMASASADKTIKLWDLNAAKCAKSYSYHTDKVCSLAWNPRESPMLLSGSYDRTVVAADMRAPQAQVPRWHVHSDVEHVVWDPHNPQNFFVTTEDGLLRYQDVRNVPTDPDSSKSIWTLQAHSNSISSFDVNNTIPGFLVTGSSDKSVKLWNVEDSGPTLVATRNLDVGRVFSTTFAPDNAVAFRLAVGGSKGNMQIWDTSTNAAVRQTFANKVPMEEGPEKQERVIAVNEDSSDSEDEGGPEPGGETEPNGWESMDEEESS